MSGASDQNKNLQIRSARLLKMISIHSARLEKTHNNDIFILVIEGRQKVKCPRPILAQWLNENWAELHSKKTVQYVSITDLGRSFLVRHASSDFADQHRMVVAETVLIDGQKSVIARNIKESPLSFLYRAKQNGKQAWLSDDEFNAGERIRADFEFAHLGPRITASWDPTANLSSQKGGRHPAEEIGDRAMDARKRLESAVNALGPELSDILLDICCFLKGLEQVEREKKWPRRSAKLLLKVSLAMLARHYQGNNSSTRARKINHWGAADYRPQL